jgi:hypothetical protein
MTHTDPVVLSKGSIYLEEKQWEGVLIFSGHLAVYGGHTGPDLQRSHVADIRYVVSLG